MWLLVHLLGRFIQNGVLRLISADGSLHIFGGHGPRPRVTIRRWTLDRRSSATYHRSGGNQPAYQSMINRRFMIVFPVYPVAAMLNSLKNKQGILVLAA
jgi:hypothetical protein